jgi:hypothetical protein
MEAVPPDLERAELRDPVFDVIERAAEEVRLLVPLFAELSNLEAEWSKVNGALTVEWEGEI